MKPITRDDVTIVILAGGKGRRMQGEDKGLLAYRERPLIQHVIDAASRQCQRILINANRNQDQYQAFGYPVIADLVPDFPGPLAGFFSAMQAASTDYILTLPCDGPIIVDEYLASMLTALNAGDAEIIVAGDGQRMQPVHALIPVNLSDSLHQFLAEGERKIVLWYQRHRIAMVEFAEDSGFFTNINSLEDLAALA
ncbi:MAG: molybdenum cofactor guanylyltransferase MobA [Gammaproteobacteria bacterium]|nr:molybdenum cofactor guanylyltransferase MobA [Gammaproteobacteria bacterium]